jgi:glycine cleavage system transcriptional repressor
MGERLNLHVEARLTEAHYEGRTGRPYLIETFSLDAPGIVHAVSAILHTYGVNIEDLETDTSAAPWTGAAMFHMRAHIIIPPSVSVANLREELSTLEQARDLDITMKPVSINWTEL